MGEGKYCKIKKKRGKGSRAQQVLDWCCMGQDGVRGRQKERDRARSTMTLVCRQRLLRERRGEKKRKEKKKVIWVLLFIANHKRPRLCCQWL